MNSCSLCLTLLAKIIVGANSTLEPSAGNGLLLASIARYAFVNIGTTTAAATIVVVIVGGATSIIVVVIVAAISRSVAVHEQVLQHLL